MENPSRARTHFICSLSEKVSDNDDNDDVVRREVDDHRESKRCRALFALVGDTIMITTTTYLPKELSIRIERTPKSPEKSMHFSSSAKHRFISHLHFCQCWKDDARSIWIRYRSRRLASPLPKFRDGGSQMTRSRKLILLRGFMTRKFISPITKRNVPWVVLWTRMSEAKIGLHWTLARK